MQVIRQGHLEWATEMLKYSCYWVCLRCRWTSLTNPGAKERPVCYHCEASLWSWTQIAAALKNGTFVIMTDTGLMYDKERMS